MNTVLLFTVTAKFPPLANVFNASLDKGLLDRLMTIRLTSKEGFLLKCDPCNKRSNLSLWRFIECLKIFPYYEK